MAVARAGYVSTHPGRLGNTMTCQCYGTTQYHATLSGGSARGDHVGCQIRLRRSRLSASGRPRWLHRSAPAAQQPHCHRSTPPPDPHPKSGNVPPCAPQLCPTTLSLSLYSKFQGRIENRQTRGCRARAQCGDAPVDWPRPRATRCVGVAWPVLSCLDGGWGEDPVQRNTDLN
jgi:hypothetical protein